MRGSSYSTTKLTPAQGSFLEIAMYVAVRLFLPADWPPGFASLAIILLLSISLNALYLGIIGSIWAGCTSG